MNDRQKLLKRLSAAQFAAWEVHLYLDTHPNDAAAIAAFNQYKRRAMELAEEYEEKYGELMPNKNTNPNSWEWLNSPWPWEPIKEGEK